MGCVEGRLYLLIGTLFKLAFVLAGIKWSPGHILFIIGMVGLWTYIDVMQIFPYLFKLC